MDGAARKRSHDDFMDNRPHDRKHSDMTKRSHKKQKPDSRMNVQSSNGGLAERNNRPGLQFASHRLNSSVKLTDLRDLVLYCMADGIAPSWISVQNKNQFQKAVVLLVPGLELGMFDGSLPLTKQALENVEKPSADAIASNASDSREQNEEWTTVQRQQSARPDDYLPTRLVLDQLPEPLKPLANIFTNLWPVKTPGDQRYSKVHSPLHTMLQKSLQETPDEKNKRKQSNAKGAKPVKVKDDFNSRKTPITDFIATSEELRENGYVLHPAMLQNEAEKQHELNKRDQLSVFESACWKDSNVEREVRKSATEPEVATEASVTDGRDVYAIDCEMCVVGLDDYALTRISVLSWDGRVVLDELVKPEKPITNYLTQYSGISEDMLENVTTTLEQIQERLIELFDANTILVGHSLDSDLKALKLTHPYIVDTSIIYPHPRGPPMKSGLKWLCQKYLSREIQKGHGSNGHNSVEDARACLDLVRLKCEKGKQWGTPDAVNESIFKLLGRKQRTGQPSGVTGGRHGAIVDIGNPERNFGSQATYSIGCKDDEGVVSAVKRCVLGDPDGEYIPGGGVELTWARLRGLDYLRGWANNNRHEDPSATNKEPSIQDLAVGVSRTVSQITSIHDSLPPCTLFIVYSGTGDPRELGRLQDLERQFKKEYQIKKWDELTVKWTDDEAQALKQACDIARSGLGLMCVT